MPEEYIVKSDPDFNGDQDDHGQLQPEAPLGVNQVGQRASGMLHGLHLVGEGCGAFLQFIFVFQPMIETFQIRAIPENIGLVIHRHTRRHAL